MTRFLKSWNQCNEKGICLKVTGYGADDLDWERIKTDPSLKLPLEPEDQFKAAYRVAFEKGTEKAHRLFDPGYPAEVKQALIKSVHYWIFKDIVHNADQTRLPDQTNIYTFEGQKRGVSPERIEQALDALCHSTAEGLRSPELSTRAAAIACFHIKLKEIQPFWDGNGRTAGVLAEGMIKLSLLNHSPELQRNFVWEIDAPKYGRALEAGVVHHRAEKMTELVIDAAGIADRISAIEEKTVSELLKSQKVLDTSRSILDPQPAGRELKAAEWLQNLGVNGLESRQSELKERDHGRAPEQTKGGHLQLSKEQLLEMNAQTSNGLFKPAELLTNEKVTAINGIPREHLLKEFQETTVLSGESRAVQGLFSRLDRELVQGQQHQPGTFNLRQSANEQSHKQVEEKKQTHSHG